MFPIQPNPSGQRTDSEDFFAETALVTRLKCKSPTVVGLGYFAAFISESDEAKSLASADSAPWLSDLKRCVQHYEYRYDYKAQC
jgi:hypothetical protein